MTFTKHGHHIPGTVHGGVQPTEVARCGGIHYCKKCKAEAEEYILSHEMPEPERQSLKTDLMAVLNKHSAENESGTPDYILAEYLLGCLTMLEQTVVHRASWRGESIDAPVVVQAREKREAVPLVIYDSKGGRNVIGTAKIETTPGEMVVPRQIEAAVALLKGAPVLYHDVQPDLPVTPVDFGQQDGG